MAAPGPGGGATGSLLFFSPLSETNIYYMSSSAIATQSNTGTTPIPNNPLNTKLFYLGSGITNTSAEAGGWYASETSSFSGSRHNMLFWMYGNSNTFPTDYSNLYYTVFQTRSLSANTFGAGIYFTNINQQKGPNSSTASVAAALIPPINAPSYNYQLIVSKSTLTTETNGGTNLVTNWTSLTQDSLRSGSGNTIFGSTAQGYGGQFNTSSGLYTFIRANLPTSSTTPVRAIPVEFTISAQFAQNPDEGITYFLRLVSGSNNTIIASFPSLTAGQGIGFVTLSSSLSLNIYSGSSTSAANLGNTSGGSTNGIYLQITSSNGIGAYRSASLRIQQPLTGRQVAFEVPLINIFNPTNLPTANDTGSYYVITPNLRAVDNIQTETFPGENVTRMNFNGAIYYFKTAYHLWRDAWKVQAADGGPICSEATWISASTNPSWAAYAIGAPDNIGPVFIRNGSYLYASRSLVPSPGTFIQYGIYSTDAAVRNRSYVGITAELLGGSELIKHLKGNAAGTISASFPGNKFGGMIVVKASRVSTDSSTAADRYYPGTTSVSPPYPSTFIWYKPGNGDSSQTTIYNPGLPITEVNDGDVIPLSNFGYDYSPGTYTPKNSNMDWPSTIPWPPADPNVSNSFYGY